MLLVRTFVSSSPIHGIGVFTAEDIPRGTVIWEFNPLIDRLIREDELAALPPHMVDFVEIYAQYFAKAGLFVLSADNDRFMNHSDAYNTDVPDPEDYYGAVVARVDIPAGTELTCDYSVIRTRRFG